MERAPAVTLEKENAMLLLKTMVLLCIVSVILTLYAEYRRMTKFEKLLNQLTPVNDPTSSSCGQGRIRLQTSSSSSPVVAAKRSPSLIAQEGRIDRGDHTPTL